MERALPKVGVTLWLRVIMYKVVFQMVILYGRKSWVVTEAMLKVLEGFHNQVTRSIAGMSDFRVREGGVGVVIGGTGIGCGEDMANKGVHLEAAVYHCGIYQ